MTPNDAEATQTTLQTLKHRLEQLQQPQHQDQQDQYAAKLHKDLLQKKRFLESANRALLTLHRDLSTKEDINGTLYTNDHVPFKFERGDSIGVAMSITSLDKQLMESKSWVEALRSEKETLEKEIEGLEAWNEQLEQVVKRLQCYKDEGQDDIRERIKRENYRGELLKRHLNELKGLPDV
jgi:DNA repair ATPase RecN